MLRNIKSLFGYKIHAEDGTIGEVYDFFFDDEKWAVRYLVADVETWLLDRKVLISPAVFGQPEWELRYFPVTLTHLRNLRDLGDRPSQFDTFHI